MGPLIGKNSQLRSRYLDSLAECKFSSHSSEHRRRSYELCILAQIGMHGMQNNHVTPLFRAIRWIIEVSYNLSREARCCTSQLLSISEAYCARLSPKGRAGTLRKWLYSIGCPRALDGKGPKRTVASRAWAAVTPSTRDCRLETIDPLLVLLGPPQFYCCLAP